MTRQTIIALVSSVVTAAVLGIAIFVSMPSTVLYPRDGSPLRDVMTTVLPESWPFFTKPPSDTEITAYVLDDGTLRSASAFPNAHRDNWFGVLRTQRAQGPEMANLTSPLPAENWVECAEDRSRDCLLIAAENEPVSIVNDYPTQTLCGNVIIVETAPVAFSYRDMYEGWRLDENAVHLDIEC